MLRKKHICLVALALSAGIAPTPVFAERIAHLYVQSCGELRNEGDQHWTGCAGRVDRFRLRHGLPAQKPDFTRVGYGATGIAVSPNGTLFTAEVFGPYAQYNTIYASPYNSKQPSRFISIPPMWECTSYENPVYVGGIAADAGDNVFVSLWSICACGPQPILRVETPTEPSDWSECTGIAIFGPRQHGNEPPEKKFDAGGANLGGVVVDSQDRVYLIDYYYYDLLEFADVFKKPRQISTIYCSPNNYIWACNEPTMDDRDDVVVTTWNNQIWVVPPLNDSAATVRNGIGPPPRNVLTLLSRPPSPDGIAASHEYIYTLYYGSVDVYRATTDGRALPVFRMPVREDAANIALGP